MVKKIFYCGLVCFHFLFVFLELADHFKSTIDIVKDLYPKGRFGLTGPYGPVPGLDVSGKMVYIEDDEYNPVNFFDGIDRNHVRSMRNHD